LPNNFDATLFFKKKTDAQILSQETVEVNAKWSCYPDCENK